MKRYLTLIFIGLLCIGVSSCYDAGNTDKTAAVDPVVNEPVEPAPEPPPPEEPAKILALKSISTHVQGEYQMDGKTVIQDYYKKVDFTYQSGFLVRADFSTDNPLIAGVLQTQEQTFKYDDAGRVREEAILLGKTQEEKIEWWRIEYKYDENGKLIETFSYFKGNPAYNNRFTYSGDVRHVEMYEYDKNTSAWKISKMSPVDSQDYNDAGLQQKDVGSLGHMSMTMKWNYTDDGALLDVSKELIVTEDDGTAHQPNQENLSIVYRDPELGTYLRHSTENKDPKEESSCTVVKAVEMDDNGTLLKETLGHVKSSCSGWISNEDLRFDRENTFEYEEVEAAPTYPPFRLFKNDLVSDKSLLFVDKPEILYGKWFFGGVM